MIEVEGGNKYSMRPNTRDCTVFADLQVYTDLIIR